MHSIQHPATFDESSSLLVLYKRNIFDCSLRLLLFIHSLVCFRVDCVHGHIFVCECGKQNS